MSPGIKNECLTIKNDREMKKREAIELYNVLNTCKLTGMSSPSKMTVLNNLRKLRPVSEAYEADSKDAVERLKPEGFDDLIKKAKEHNEAINAGNKPTLTGEELKNTASVIEAYNKEVNACVDGILDEESGIEIEKIGKADMEKLLDANDIEVSKLSIFYNAMLND